MDYGAEKISTSVKATNVKNDSYWPGLFTKLFEKKNIKNIILNIGSGGGTSVAAAAPAGKEKNCSVSDGLGRVFQALEDYGAANHYECGERIPGALQSWSSTNVLRKFTGPQNSLLSRFHSICDTKLKLLESMK